ncbi:MAG: TonB-dependent receptor [Bacteroidetes bacterium]|nr:MAG: TonB-dependent receptor [Bacteroidota bacterium]REK00001.1 MAG: TonB-dependent receptor [Bacteroidota bacterium]REK35820.1 MAG: TonB-dependent receptor [Bacteroidota bacterium]REK49309.1 MAG: TonB-dependent receptor [Bacteroidota bacterium]
MKCGKIVLWLCMGLSFVRVQAQQAGQFRNLPDSVRQNMPKIGKVSGQVMDGATGEPVGFASVAVLSVPDSSLVGGNMTDEKGNFQISELPYGRYCLQISFVGYSTRFSDPFGIMPQNTEHHSGVIKLNTSASRLKQIDVVGEKSEFNNSLDRKVYNVDKNIVNTGGTVTEVMQNIPSVTVDIDGRVSLRGSENVSILIDGKPSGMLGSDRKAVLDQIPASAVDQIEVITNPSAKYEASGMAGIINIKTKKEKMKGLNGNVSAGVGSNDKYNLSGGLNNRTAKTNIHTNFSYRNDTRSTTGTGIQQHYFPDREPYYYTFNSQGTRKSEFVSGKVGADFYLDQRNVIGISGSANRRTEYDPDQVEYSFFNNSDVLMHSYYNFSNGDESNEGYDLNLDYKRSWPSSKSEFTFTGSLSENQRIDFSRNSNSNLYNALIPYQLNDNVNDFGALTFQADLLRPFDDKGKLESGLRSSQRDIANNQMVFYYKEKSGNYLEDPLKTDRFVFKEHVMAAYAMYTGKLKKFDYNAGLRAELTDNEGESESATTSFSNDYLSFFPSAFLRYNFEKSRELQISYTKRVNRPESRTLNPYADYSDSLFIRRGNPDLKPEFIHSLELAHNRTIGPLNLTASLYFRHTEDLISRFRSIDTASGVATMMFRNFSTSQNLGFETVLRYQHDKFGNVMATFNVYRNEINGSNIEPDLQSESTQWFTRVNVNIRATKSTNLQITGNYMAPNNTPVSRFRGMSGVDAGIRQDIWKGKGSLSLNVTDIFNTRKFRIKNFGDFYELNLVRTRESRVATLTLAYRFGKQDNQSQRRRSQRNQQQEMNMEMMDF